MCKSHDEVHVLVLQMKVVGLVNRDRVSNFNGCLKGIPSIICSASKLVLTSVAFFFHKYYVQVLTDTFELEHSGMFIHNEVK